MASIEKAARRRAWRLNYGISRVVRIKGRNRIRTLDGWLLTSLDYDAPNFHERIKARVHRIHPGWSLMGYCPHKPRA